MSQEATEAQSGDQKVLVAEIPADQRFSFRITPLPGRLMDLATIGGSIQALAKLHAAIGEDIDPNVKWKSCLAGAEIEADGSFRVDIVLAPIEKKERKRRGKPAAPVQPDMED